MLTLHAAELMDTVGIKGARSEIAPTVRSLACRR
jgi:hypothetical protein